jgi:hypothetical protein
MFELTLHVQCEEQALAAARAVFPDAELTAWGKGRPGTHCYITAGSRGQVGMVQHEPDVEIPVTGGEFGRFVLVQVAWGDWESILATLSMKEHGELEGEALENFCERWRITPDELRDQITDWTDGGRIVPKPSSPLDVPTRVVGFHDFEHGLEEYSTRSKALRIAAEDNRVAMATGKTDHWMLVLEAGDAQPSRAYVDLAGDSIEVVVESPTRFSIVQATDLEVAALCPAMASVAV